MAMNLSGYRVRVGARMGIPSGDTFMSPTIINDAINQALVTVEEEAFWPWSEAAARLTVLSGTVGVVLPDDWRATKGVYVGQWELRQVSITDLFTWPDSSQGMPSVWSDYQDTVEVRPAAAGDRELTVIYYRMQPLLVNDTDRPMIPDRFHPAVVAKACELLARREDDGPNQAAHLADYTVWTGRMRKAMRSTTRPITPRVRPGSWYDW
jgi:hypothetical protein